MGGILVDSISLDTSSSITYTIEYVATDLDDNTATSTRTVIVKPRSSSSPVPGQAVTDVDESATLTLPDSTIASPAEAD